MARRRTILDKLKTSVGREGSRTQETELDLRYEADFDETSFYDDVPPSARTSVQRYSGLGDSWWLFDDRAFEAEPSPERRSSRRSKSEKTYKPLPKWTSAGGVVIHAFTPEGIGVVYLCKPSNGFGPWSFPKGRVDEGETLEQAAIREVEEESGLKARILPNSYLGSGEGIESITHYYVMIRTGGNPARHDFEHERVEAFTLDEAEAVLTEARNKRDLMILAKAREYIQELRIRMFGG